MAGKIRKSNNILGNIGLITLSMIFIIVTLLGVVLIESGLRLIVSSVFLAQGIARISIAVIILYFFKKRHTHITIGLVGKGLGQGFLLGWVILIAAVINFYEAVETIDWENALVPKAIDYLFYIVNVVGIGIFEEALLRGVILNNMLDRWGDKKSSIYGAVITSSLLFGFWHLINLLDHPRLIVTTITQIGYAFFIGAFFGAIYLRTKNLWVVSLLHAIFDIGGCLDELFVEESILELTQDITVGEGLLTLAEFSIFLIVGLFYLRKVKVEVQGEAINQSVEMIQG